MPVFLTYIFNRFYFQEMVSKMLRWGKFLTVLILVQIMSTSVYSQISVQSRLARSVQSHPEIRLYSAYPARSLDVDNYSDGGFNGLLADTIKSAPGLFNIVPGDKWSNFIKAHKDGSAYNIKNTLLSKYTTAPFQCADIYFPMIIRQHGTPNVRLHWPLLYETAGTKWELNLFYGTYQPYDIDGVGPILPSYVHNEIWTWRLEADIYSMIRVLDVFHQLPFGKSGVPIISNEELYTYLRYMLIEVQNYIDAGDFISAGLMLAEFEMEAMDWAVATTPNHANLNGIGTGIANTKENPALCKLLTDAEYVGFKYGIFVQTKK